MARYDLVSLFHRSCGNRPAENDCGSPVLNAQCVCSFIAACNSGRSRRKKLKTLVTAWTEQLRQSLSLPLEPLKRMQTTPQRG